jgi:GTP cyclohydrolase III
MRRNTLTILFSALLLVAVMLAVGTATTPAESQEEAPTLARMARMIQDGEIDVGDDYGMGKDQRFHVIHADTIDMSCKQCHVNEAPYEIVAPYSEDADPVDRRVCLGCHLNGPAQPLYDPQE